MLEQQLAGVDLVMVVAHGPLGGSGCLHAATRALGFPVLGPSALAIELAFDKLRARERLQQHNVPVPRSALLGPSAWDRSELATLGWPCVIKPRRGAGGEGVRRLERAQHVSAAIAEADAGEDELLIERELVGREFAAVVLDGQILGVAELEHGPWRGRASPATTVCPAPIDARRRAGIENLARRACAALELREGPARVDMIVSERGNEFVLEVEPLPPVHRDSLVARVARAAGLSYPRLCAQLLGGPILEPRGVRRQRVARAAARLSS